MAPPAPLAARPVTIHLPQGPLPTRATTYMTALRKLHLPWRAAPSGHRALPSAASRLTPHLCRATTCLSSIRAATLRRLNRHLHAPPATLRWGRDVNALPARTYAVAAAARSLPTGELLRAFAAPSTPTSHPACTTCRHLGPCRSPAATYQRATSPTPSCTTCCGDSPGRARTETFSGFICGQLLNLPLSFWHLLVPTREGGRQEEEGLIAPVQLHQACMPPALARPSGSISYALNLLPLATNSGSSLPSARPSTCGHTAVVARAGHCLSARLAHLHLPAGC